MKRYLVLLSVAVVMGALTMVTVGIVSGKAHVPIHKVQVCHKGNEVIEVGASALPAHLNHGDVEVPACDLSNIFQKGDDCSGVEDTDGDGQANFTTTTPLATEACPDGKF